MPGSQRGQIVKWKGQRGRDGQWVMEGLTWGETVGREAESENASMKAIAWNENNGFSSLINRSYMCWEKRVSWSLKLFFKIKIIEDTMNVRVLRELPLTCFALFFPWPDIACFSRTIACRQVRCIFSASSPWGITALNWNTVVLFWGSARPPLSLPSL